MSVGSGIDADHTEKRKKTVISTEYYRINGVALTQLQPYATAGILWV